MQDILVQVYPHLIEAVASVVIALVGVASTWAINSLRKKFDAQAATGKHEAVYYAMDIIKSVSDTVVRELEQTVVPEVKKALEDGKLSQEEAKKIKCLAVDRVKNYMNNDLSIVNVPVAVIESAIEAAVYRLKDAKND